MRRRAIAHRHQETPDEHHRARRDPAHPIRGRLTRLHLQLTRDDGQEIHGIE